MIKIGKLNLKLSSKLYKDIANILVPEKKWIRYTKKKVDNVYIIKVIASDKSELYHFDYGFKTYNFEPNYWNSTTGYTFLENIINIDIKLKQIKKLYEL